jgi:chromosome partitioning protein
MLIRVRDKPMRTITFASAKGGVGKSTLAASLGVAALQAGEKPFLIDMDAQGSLTAWGGRRTGDDLPVDRIDAARLPNALAGLAGAGYAAAAAMRAADLVIIPARPSTLDLEASRPTLAALARLDRPYAFVLNACAGGRSSRIEDASRARRCSGCWPTRQSCSAPIMWTPLGSAWASLGSAWASPK